MKNKHFLSVFLLCLFSLAGWSQSYYVATNGSNTNAGTEASPWKTIQYAVDAVNAGATIYVKSGTYSEKVVFNGATDAGSAGKLVTLTNAIGSSPIIDGSNLTSSGREGLITVKGSSYIKISGFQLKNFFSTGSATPCGFYMEGTCSNVEFSNNKISNIKNTSTCKDPCGVGAHGIGIFGTTSTGIKNVVFDNNEVFNCILQASEAFVINGNVSYFTQTKNYVHDNNNIGFDYIGYEGECSGCGELDRARNGIVKNNRATNNRSDLANPWYAGHASAGGFYVDGGQDITFDGNISNGNNMGFEVASEHNNKSRENIIVRNNVIYSNTEVGISLGGSVSNAKASNIAVINNSFYKNRGWGSEIVFQKNVVNSFVQNNIFYADNTAAYENQGSGSTGNMWSNNLYFNGTAASGSISTADPKFTNPAAGDFTLQVSSPAINKGLNTASNIGTLDLKGNQRILNTTVDIGAYEYGSVTNTCATFATIQSESYNSMSGVILESSSDTGGGQQIGYIHNGEWTSHSNIDLTCAKSIEARVSSRTSGGKIEVRLGSATGTLIGTMSVAGTGSWHNWTTVSANISAVSGKQNVYLVYKGGAGYLFNVNWVKFNSTSSSQRSSSEKMALDILGNPVEDILNIRTSASNTANLEIVDHLGLKVLSRDIKEESTGIDVSSLPAGIYIVRVTDGEHVETKKIIKK